MAPIEVGHIEFTTDHKFMKYIITLLLFIAVNLAFGDSAIRITANRDNTGAIKDYTVTTWNGKDLAQVDTKYSVAEAQALYGKLIDGSELLTDRNTLVFDGAGALIKVVSQSASVKTYDMVDGKPTNETITGEFASVVKSTDELPAAVQTDVTDLKTDIETKTGKPIDGKDKPIEEPVEPEP